MSDMTARLALPLIAAGQAQKEIFHNEALTTLDALVQPSVEAVGLNTPPSGPSEGQCWIVGLAPTDGWAGQADSIASWSGGGWRFVLPHDGMSVWSVPDASWAYRTAGAWKVGVLPVRSVEIGGEQVLGPRAADIADPVGGGVIDPQARSAIGAILVALRQHGLIGS